MKYQTKIIDGQEVCFSADWINDLESETHFNWYYHQAKLVYNNCLRTQKILEIGIGTGVLSDLLRKRGWDINTLDIDDNKQPDFCTNALEFKYKDHSIETILAFEIFEHIPYATFEKMVSIFSKENVINIYFSLPWNRKIIFDLTLKLPQIPPLNWSLRIPKGKINTQTHFWELENIEKNLDDKRLITIENLEIVFGRNDYEMIPLNKVGYVQYFSAQRKL